ncbi:hypothetical protein C8R47DRAFT_1144972, partial [Mycena vitilis]
MRQFVPGSPTLLSGAKYHRTSPITCIHEPHPVVDRHHGPLGIREVGGVEFSIIQESVKCSMFTGTFSVHNLLRMENQSEAEPVSARVGFGINRLHFVIAQIVFAQVFLVVSPVLRLFQSKFTTASVADAVDKDTLFGRDDKTSGVDRQGHK